MKIRFKFSRYNCISKTYINLQIIPTSHTLDIDNDYDHRNISKEKLGEICASINNVTTTYCITSKMGKRIHHALHMLVVH